MEMETNVILAVRRAIAACLPQGNPGIDSVARAVGVNARTLQRRLARQHLTYRQLVDDVRLEKARKLLEKDAGTVIGEVSRAVGYSDPAHFTRAFLRWTGMTPREFHRRARQRVDL